eukprot:15331557-Ditylum_brightwellii.AAC.1
MIGLGDKRAHPVVHCRHLCRCLCTIQQSTTSNPTNHPTYVSNILFIDNINVRDTLVLSSNIAMLCHRILTISNAMTPEYPTMCVHLSPPIVC